MGRVESRDRFIFKSNSKIKSKPSDRLPFILYENRISYIGGFATRAKLIINAATDNGYAGSKRRQRIKRAGRTRRTSGCPLNIDEITIDTSGARSIIQICTPLAAALKNAARRDVIKDRAPLVTALYFMTAEATEQISQIGVPRSAKRNVLGDLIVATDIGEALTAASLGDIRCRNTLTNKSRIARDTIRSKLLVLESASIANVRYQLAHRRPHAFDSKQVRVLSSALESSKIGALICCSAKRRRSR